MQARTLHSGPWDPEAQRVTRAIRHERLAQPDASGPCGPEHPRVIQELSDVIGGQREDERTAGNPSSSSVSLRD